MKYLAIASCLIIALSAGVGAGEIALTGQGGAGTGIQIVSDQVTNKDAPAIVLECTIEKLMAFEVKTCEERREKAGPERTHAMGLRHGVCWLLDGSPIASFPARRPP